MSALVIDTSSWISYFAGHGSPHIDEALNEGRVFIPLVVAAELISGTLSKQDQCRLESIIQNLPSCGNDVAHWLRVGKLRARLRTHGFSISTPDAHVAQCTLDLGGALLTEDAIFKKIATHARLTVL